MIVVRNSSGSKFRWGVPLAGIAICGMILSSGRAVADVDVWLTRGDQVSLLELRPELTLESGSGSHSTKINIDAANQYQTIDGFGAALTDSSAWLIQYELNTSQRQALMEQLFSTDLGIGMSFLRLPMGASDFALSAYTYDDMPAGQTDPTLSNFSIAHDQTYIIPTLLDARALNPQLKIMASPWSPPAWMKNTGTLWGGSLKTEYYDEYAQYFVRFVQDYVAAGVPIYCVTPQNEPLNDTTAMPAATMQTYQQSAFVGDHLGPAFAAAGLGTKIIVFDHNWSDWNYPVIVLNDAEAGQYAAGAAFHGYAGDVSQQTQFHDVHPDAEVHFTEITGGDWSPDFADSLVWGLQNIIIGSVRNWSRSAIYWNIALDQNHGPRIGGCSDCRGLVTINTNTGNVTFGPEYYTVAHASKFVRPGAQRIASDSIAGVIETVAFQNPDGSKVLIAVNPGGSARWFDAVIDSEHFSYRLTGESVATFTWDTYVVGDFDGDNDVDFDDIDDGVQGNSNSLFDYLGQPPPRPGDDLDSEGGSAGVIDAADLQALIESLIGSHIGDVNRDYIVDTQDFAVLAAGLGSAGGYFAGDLDANLTVDLRDFARLQREFQPSQEPSANLIVNPGFLDLNGDGAFGDQWGQWGNTGFNDYWGGNPHASFFAEQSGYYGGVYQMGIPAVPGTQYELTLTNVRVEVNAAAEFRFGLEFYSTDDATLISDTLVPLDLAPSGDGLSFEMSATAPANAVFVRPIIRFENVTSSAAERENVFVFETDLRALPGS